MHWTPDASSARAALTDFVPRAGTAYTRRRNYDLGPDDRANVSGLSPWLRHRLLLEEDVLAAVLREHDLSSAQTFVHEVFWRTYFKGWLEHRPGVWLQYVCDLEDLGEQLAEDRALRERWIQARAGRTGIDAFDAWAVELRDTGYLHNHARMWFASIWVFTLQLPWQLGAAHFHHHLLDADPASNTLSWRWVAGLHTRGKHYLARPDNIAKYTEGRFAPGAVLDTAAPALEEEEPLPMIQPIEPADEAPSDRRHGLLLTVDDACAASLPLADAPSVIATLDAANHTAIGTTADADALPIVGGVPVRDARASAFARGALVDARDRAAVHFDLRGEPSASFDAADPMWIDRVIAWAREAALETVVTAWAPVGPTATALDELAVALRREGLELRRVRRAYDTLAWPHATKGFFRLKKKIPGILRALGLR